MNANDERQGWKSASEHTATRRQNQVIETEKLLVTENARSATEERKEARHLQHILNTAEEISHPGDYEEAIKAHNERAEEFDKNAEAHLEELKKALNSTDLFLDQAPVYLPYEPSELPFSIGDYCGRVSVDKESMQMIVDVPDYIELAELIPETGEATLFTVNGAIMVITTEESDRTIIFDLLTMPESVYNDDKTTAENVFKNVHSKRITSRENAKALSLLSAGRDPETVSVNNLLTAVNSNLCAMAKRETEIWTNSTGFAFLDIDVNGVPLVRKTPDGDFIFKEKYIIREFPEKVLPNLNEGAPIFAGAMKDVIRFGMLSDESAIKEHSFPNNIDHREIVEEIPVVTTQSKSAYIYGCITE